ncbi:MAG: hypothetical protein AAB267_04720 [Candidatus Desantisbacteria bacterium]
MEFRFIDWKRSIMLGVIAGITWGWVAIVINTISGAFPFETTLLQRLVTFSVGGAIFGIVVSGFLSLLHSWLPFKRAYSKAVFISVCLWLILRLGGAVLSMVDGERYHLVNSQTIQGFILATMMGGFLGLLSKINKKEV